MARGKRMVKTVWWHLLSDSSNQGCARGERSAPGTRIAVAFYTSILLLFCCCCYCRPLRRDAAGAHLFSIQSFLSTKTTLFDASMGIVIGYLSNDVRWNWFLLHGSYPRRRERYLSCRKFIPKVLRALEWRANEKNSKGVSGVYRCNCYCSNRGMQKSDTNTYDFFLLFSAPYQDATSMRIKWKGR